MRTQKRFYQRIEGGRRMILALLAALLLAGCAGGSHVGEAWQCPLAQGVACASVSEADPAVAAQEEARKTAFPVPLRRVETPVSETLGGLFAWFAELFGFGEEREEDTATAEPLFLPPAPDTPDPADETLRTKERIARIWIAPFVDAEGVYREAGWVRVVVEPARWRLP